MFPEPLTFGPIKIWPMGLAWALGFVLGLWLAVWRAKRQNVSQSLIVNLFVILLFSALAGTKIAFLIFHLPSVISQPVRFLNADMSGSSSLGAITLSILVAYIYLRKRVENVWHVLDVVTPSWALIVALGRLGCLTSGCCFGKPTESGIGLVFPANSPAGIIFPGTPLIPTQLLGATKGFVLMGVSLLIDRVRNFHGQTFCSVLLLYGLSRFVGDFCRYYEKEMTLFSTGEYSIVVTQLFSLALIAGALMLFLWVKNCAKPSLEAEGFLASLVLKC